MYRTVRDIHLLLGLFAWPFALLYAISALQMAHPEALHANSADSTSHLQLTAAARATPDAARDFLRSHGDVRGTLTKSEKMADTLVLQLERPGTTYDVTVRADGETTIVEHHGNTLRLLNRLHHAASVWSDFGASNVWGALVIMVSLALLGLGVTGIWLWFLRKVERRAGLVFLGVSVLYAGGLLLLIRLA